VVEGKSIEQQYSLLGERNGGVSRIYCSLECHDWGEGRVYIESSREEGDCIFPEEFRERGGMFREEGGGRRDKGDRGGQGRSKEEKIMGGGGYPGFIFLLEGEKGEGKWIM
jgi:hypothetical protein